MVEFTAILVASFFVGEKGNTSEYSFFSPGNNNFQFDIVIFL